MLHEVRTLLTYLLEHPTKLVRGKADAKPTLLCEIDGKWQRCLPFPLPAS